MQFIEASHYSKGRPYGIDGICIHHMAGKLTAAECGQLFANPKREGSAHYGIGYDLSVAQYVPENARAWGSKDGIGYNSRGNDRSIHIEVSNSANDGSYRISDEVFDKLVEVAYDIAKRNNLLPLTAGGNLFAHRDVSPTYCPGDYLYNKLHELAKRVNAIEGQPTPGPEEPVLPGSNGLPARGYIKRGDNLPLVGKIAKFMRATFPAYTTTAALGNYYGPNIEASIKEFQRRAKADGKYNDDVDGCVGPITVKALKAYGFRG